MYQLKDLSFNSISFFILLLQLSAKFDTELANQVLIWMKDTINSNLGADEQPVDFDTDGQMKHFAEVLKDGVVLAR